MITNLVRKKNKIFSKQLISEQQCISTAQYKHGLASRWPHSDIT